LEGKLDLSKRTDEIEKIGEDGDLRVSAKRKAGERVVARRECEVLERIGE
jgi:hypothetical protein